MLQSAVTSTDFSGHCGVNGLSKLSISTGDNHVVLDSQSSKLDNPKTTKPKEKAIFSRKSPSQNSSANKRAAKSSAARATYSASEGQCTHVLDGLKDCKIFNSSRWFRSKQLSEDKTKQLHVKCIRPEKCENLISTRVNSEIWRKIRFNTRSRDLGMQKRATSLLNSTNPIIKISDKLLELV